MVVYPANNRLFGLAVHKRLSLSLPLHSLLRLTFLPSFSKQAKQKLTKLRFADGDSDPVQNAGPTLTLDEAASRTELELELLQSDRPRGAVRQDVEEKISEQTKLASTTGFLKANLQLG